MQYELSNYFAYKSLIEMIKNQ